MSRRTEQGIALIAVLWMLTLLSLIAAAIAFEARSDSRRASNMADLATARAAADAGIQRAILDLASPNIPTAKKLHADGTAYNWQFAHHTVRISIADEADKIDLNQAPPELLTGLFKSVGVDAGTAPSLAGAVADFRDSDSAVRPHGAELAQYQGAGLAWGPKNAPFQTVEELRQVLGMTPELYAKLAPQLTIYYVSDTINPAEPSALLAQFLQRIGLKLQYPATSAGLVFTIHSEAYGSKGTVFVREAIVALSDSNTPSLLGWRQYIQ